MILSLRPGLPLSSTVECIWHYEGEAVAHGRENVLPDGRFQIVLNLAAGKGAVCGLRSQHVVVDPALISLMMGVVFRPGGAVGFLGASPLEFLDRSVPLDLVWGASPLLEQLRDTASVRTRLCRLEAALTQRMLRDRKGHTTTPRAIDYALRAFNNAPHIGTVADVSLEIGRSRRWFSQAFGEQVGMTPKRYCRLMRFQTTVRQIASGQSVNWADIAQAGGFSDQAHLVHEFRAFSGLSPERFRVAERPFPNHVRTD